MPRARLSISPTGSLAVNGQAWRKVSQCHLLELCGGAAVNRAWPSFRKLHRADVPAVSFTLTDPAARRAGVEASVGLQVSQCVLKVGKAEKVRSSSRECCCLRLGAARNRCLQLREKRVLMKKSLT